VADTSPADEGPPFYLTELSRDQQVVWDAAYQSGYLAGHEAGWQAADDHAAAMFSRAARIVRRHADLPDLTAEQQVEVAEAKRRLGAA
jgi:hypothetical protein